MRVCMRVAVVGTRGLPDLQGGVERHCQELYSRLISLGCKVRVYARKGYVEPGTRSYKGVEVLPLWAPRSKNLEAIVHTFLALMHLTRHRKQFDIIHFHAIGPSLLVPLARCLGLNVVTTNHGPDYDRQKWGSTAKAMLRLGQYLGTRFASATIAVSQHIRQYLQERYRKAVIYIPNGVTIQESAPPGSLLDRCGVAAGKYLLAVGRLVPEKGLHDLLEAFEEMDTDWKLVIAGEADHEDDYSRSLKKKVAGNPRVVMLGFVRGQELAEAYSHAAFLVQPSYHEGLPLSVLEAMSYGLAVLASNIPAHRELVPEELLFPPGDKSCLKQKLSQAIQHPPGPGVLAANRRRIEADFNWDSIAKKTLSVYAAAVARGRGGARPPDGP